MAEIKDSINFRRHKGACTFYRERWNFDPDAEEPGLLYQVFCLKGFPPETQEQQDQCMVAKTGCWRCGGHGFPSASEAPPAETRVTPESQPARTR